jgi:hypothetical protein
MGIAGDKPRQFAPTVGTTGSGSTDSPAPSPTNAKIDIDPAIDTAVGIAVPICTDTNAEIDIDSAIDTIVGIAVSNGADTNAKIDIDLAIDTAVGIAVSIYTNVDADISIDATPSSATKLVSAATIVGPISGMTGAVSAITGGFDLAFELFSFHMDDNGVAELISVSDSAPPAMTPGTPPVTGGNPSATALLAPSAPLEEEPRLEELTPSVGSNGFKDPPPSSTTAYCVDCDAYHYVGARDFSSHEIAGCEDPWGARQLSTRQYLSASGLSTPSRFVPPHMILTTSKGYIRTTHARTMTMTSTPKLRGKSAIQQVPAHQANLPHQATTTRPIMTLIS